MTRAVTIRGTWYASQTAAARALGVTSATVNIAHKAGQTHLDRVGLGPQWVKGADAPTREEKARRAFKGVKIHGATYASNQHAAAALGVHETYISAWRSVERAALKAGGS